MATNILIPLLGPEPDLNLPPILDGILDRLDYHSILNFIDAFPAHLGLVYSWGLGPTGIWQDQIFQCIHHGEVIARHSERQGVNILPLPLDPAIREANLADSEFPITNCVRNNRLDILQRLHSDGLWEPLGWTVDGYSFLKIACDNHALDVVTYIIRHAGGNATFCTSGSTVPAITGVQQVIRVTHLDLALENGLDNTFWSWWTAIQPQPDAYILLNRNSRRRLCEISTYRQAHDLFNDNGIDLSACIRRMGNIVPEDYPFPDGAGTPWHLAVRNPNVDFIDFLVSRIPAQIDWLQGEARSPLVEALEEGKYEHFDRLLSCAADPRLPTTRILSRIAHWNSKWFISVQQWIRYPIPKGQGSALHTIVNGLNAELERIKQNRELTPQQRANQKRQKIKRAKRLIVHVRHGNVYGQPSLGLTNSLGRTPHELAVMYGFHWIYSALTPRRLR